jgi:hypothetical protein
MRPCISALIPVLLCIECALAFDDSILGVWKNPAPLSYGNFVLPFALRSSILGYDYSLLPPVDMLQL